MITRIRLTSPQLDQKILAWIRRPSTIIVALLVIAALLRLVRLDQVPASLYWEEVALGYDAYSIARTGKDHHGNPYPLIAFPSFGDYKPSGYFYALVPFVSLFGLTEWAVRLPSALAGIASVYLLYRIAAATLSARYGLLAAFLFALQPWHLQFSRGGWEVNLALFWLLLGTTLVLSARKRPLLLPLGVLAFAASMYTYHAARLLAPMIGGSLGLWLMWEWFVAQGVAIRGNLAHSRQQQIVSFVLSICIAVLAVSPFLFSLGRASVSSRFSQTSIFTSLTPIEQSNLAIAECGATRVCKLLHHRYRYFGQRIVGQWFSHLSPSFLFLRGDGNLRHGTVRFGLLYPWEAIAILVTLALTLRSLRRRTREAGQQRMIPAIVIGCLLWIGFSAVPASLVTPAPHALRFLFAAPAFALLGSIGLYAVYDVLTRRQRFVYLGVLIALITYGSSTYLSWYHTGFAVESAADYQYGYKQLYQGIEQYKRDGEQVYITRDQGRPAMYYLFYSAYDPAKIQTESASLPKDQLELLRVGDYHFVDALPSGSGLFATPLEEQDPNAEFIGYIRRPDWSVVWSVWRRSK